MADFAIWMAGHVSVPLYPTLAAGTIRQILEHSESKLLFVGKLDGWDGDEARRSGRRCRASRMPLAPPNDYPQWDDDRRRDAAAGGRAGARRRRARDHHVHLGHHRRAQGRDAQLRAPSPGRSTAGLKRVPRSTRSARMLSYLPLAHVAERALVEHGAAGHRHARLLRREPRDLHRRPAARAADRLLLGAAPVGQVPAGRQRQDAAGEAGAPAEASRSSRGIVRKKILRALGLDSTALRRRRRRADAARAAALVRAPRPDRSSRSTA